MLDELLENRKASKNATQSNAYTDILDELDKILELESQDQEIED